MPVKVKDLVEQLGVSRPTVLKYIKEELGIVPEPKKALVLTDEQASIIAAKIGAPVQNIQVEKSVVDLLVENARLTERVHGLEAQVEILTGRAMAAEAALEREQSRPHNLWERLGQKRLSEGKVQN